MRRVSTKDKTRQADAEAIPVDGDDAGAVAPGRPPDDGRWPVAVRAVVITGSAAALWGMIWLSYKLLQA